MAAYYNEIESYAAEWLRNLIKAGLIADGEVDERSIVDVEPRDLAGFNQCHFFAGIGGHSRALRIAGWPDDKPVWTGSCPCQPFSAAGKGVGFADERHLWPYWFWLIEECRPPIIFGEQVASKAGLEWFNLVHADLEGAGYAVGAADLCAAGVGAPHIRQRLWFVADASGVERERKREQPAAGGQRQGTAGGRYSSGLVADADDTGFQERKRVRGFQREALGEYERQASQRSSNIGWMADADGRDASPEGPQRGGEQRQQPKDGGAGGVADGSANGRREERSDAGRFAFGDSAEGIAARFGAGRSDSRPGPPDGFWRDADWLLCQDGKWRPVEPGAFPLAHGIPNRVGRLRAYGNAIVPQVAAEFVQSYVESVETRDDALSTNSNR